MKQFVGGLVVGGLIGTAATYICLKKQHEEQIREEVASVKATLLAQKDKAVEDATKTAAAKAAKEKPLMEYKKMVEDLNYSAPIPAEDETPDIYIIDPAEANTQDGYEMTTLIYYSDGVLASDDDDSLVSCPEELVGTEWVDRFGEYEPDSVYIRNERLCADYEILRDRREWPGGLS